MARNRFNSSTAPKDELPKSKINKESLHKIAGLLAYLKPYRWKFIIGLLCLFLSSLTGLAFPSLLGAMIDAAQGKQKLSYIPASL